MRDLEGLIAERDRIEATLDRCAQKEESLAKVEAEIARRTAAAAGDTKALAQLKVESDQTAEAKRLNTHQSAEARKRLQEIEKVIEMQAESDMS